MDSLPLGARLPGEDEFAMALAGLSSPYLGVGFPIHREYYSRYLTFEDTSPHEKEKFLEVMNDFILRLALRYPGKRLLLKSPGHTARIELILSKYPNAKFVHIARNPFKVFQSSKHIAESFFPYNNFQSMDWKWVEEDILNRYTKLYQAYFKQKHLIPKGNLFELKFENLTTHPFETLASIFQHFGWDHLSLSRLHFEKYLESTRNYKPNLLQPLTERELDLIRSQWGIYFAAFGYGPA